MGEREQHAAPDRWATVGRDLHGAIVQGDANQVSVGTGLTTAHRRWLTWLAVVAVLVVGGIVVLTVTLVDQRGRRPAPIRVGAYTTTVSGSVVGGDAFELQGELRVRESTDDLPYEWCLKVGDPWATPAPGAVWFGSNGTCFGAMRDAAVVTLVETGGETVLSPYTRAPSLHESANGFTATSGSFAGTYLPDRGDVRFRTTQGGIEGTLSLQGSTAMSGHGRGAFTATLRASFVSDDPEEVLSWPARAVGPAATGATVDPGPGRGIRYVVKTVTGFTQTEGSPEYARSERARFEGAVLVVDARDGGTFVYDPANSRTDVFPVTGAVTSAEPLYVLSGRRAIEQENFSATAVVGGTLDLSGREPVVRLTLATSTTTTIRTATTTARDSTSVSYEVEAVLQAHRY